MAINALKTTIAKYYMALFWVMIFVYSLYSSSTPDSYGLAELTIGLILVFLVGFRRVIWVFSLADMGEKNKYGTQVPIYVVLSLIYLLLIPTINGLLFTGNSISDYIRDVIPLLYFFLPVLLLHRMVQFPERWLFFTVSGLCIVGVLFAIRHFTESGSSISDVGQTFIFGTSAYFAQDPAVQFAGAFLVCFGIVSLMESHYLRAAFCLMLAIFPWAAMFGIIARAPTILVVFSIILTIAYYFLNSRKRIRAVLLLLAFSILIFGLFHENISRLLEGVIQLLMEKQAKHGLSSRDLEMKAVLDNVDGIRVLLFGEGWGGLMANPTGNGAKFRFVHNMFGYFFMKSGLFGMLALFFYIFWYVKMLTGILRKQISPLYFSMLAAMIVPMVINMMLEAGYKTLSFGLLLLLIPLLQRVCMKNRERFVLQLRDSRSRSRVLSSGGA